MELNDIRVLLSYLPKKRSQKMEVRSGLAYDCRLAIESLLKTISDLEDQMEMITEEE